MKRIGKLILAMTMSLVSAFSFVGCVEAEVKYVDKVVEQVDTSTVVVSEPVKDSNAYYNGLNNTLPGEQANATQFEMEYYDQLDPDKEKNEDLWYRNDMEARCADPTAIYIDHGPEEGWFYIYPTSDSQFGCQGFVAYKSRDMQKWESVGAIFAPDPDCWAQNSLWAPECIYDPETELYYFFFSAADQYGVMRKDSTHVLYDAEFQQLSGIGRNFFQIGMAYSENPYGPFKLYQNSEKRFKEDAAILQHYNRTQDSFIIDYTDDQKVQYFANEYYGGDTAALLADLEPNPNYDPKSKEVFTDTPYLGHEDVVEAGNAQIAYYKSLDPTWRLGSDSNSVTSDQQVYTMIDIHPYIDHDGQRYLYVVHDWGLHHWGSQSCAIKLDKNWTNSWYTDEEGEFVTDENGDRITVYSSFTYLTNSGYYTVDRQPNPYTKEALTDLNEGGTNEGPYMYYNPDNKKYYLSISVNGYTQSAYSLVQAIGDSPMGPFRKLSLEEGGKYLTRDQDWNYISGPGHHSFVKCKGRLYNVYHSHFNRTQGNSQRGTCTDEMFFIDNGRGNTVMYCNGPSYTLMPKIGMDAEYRNISYEAELTAYGIGNQDGSVLNDEVIANHEHIDFVKEVEFGRGSRLGMINLSFKDAEGNPEYRTLRALMIFNSKSFVKIFKQISRIEFDFKKVVDGKTVYGTSYIEDLGFDIDQYCYGNTWVRQCRTLSSAIAEFDETDIANIRIYIDAAADKHIETDYTFYNASAGRYYEMDGDVEVLLPNVVAISEIYVIGK